MSVEENILFIEELKKFSGNKIKNGEDLGLLLNAAAKNGKFDLFEKTAFTAKYINGLKRVLITGADNPEITNIEQIRQDMMDNYKKIADQITNMLEGEDELIIRFRKNYLELRQESFERLNSLLDDLEWVKVFLNEQKRK